MNCIRNIYTYTQTYTCTHDGGNMIYTGRRTGMNLRSHIHVRMHIHTHTYTYTYTCDETNRISTGESGMNLRSLIHVLMHYTYTYTYIHDGANRISTGKRSGINSKKPTSTKGKDLSLSSGSLAPRRTLHTTASTDMSRYACMHVCIYVFMVWYLSL